MLETDPAQDKANDPGDVEPRQAGTQTGTTLMNGDELTPDGG